MSRQVDGEEIDLCMGKRTKDTWPLACYAIPFDSDTFTGVR